MNSVAFVGVDLQEDYLGPNPLVDLQGSEAVRTVAQSLVSAATSKGIPLLLTADVHDDDDSVFESFPHHCVKGSAGEALWSELALSTAARIEAGATQLPTLGTGPVVLETRDHRRGLFGNATADALLESLETNLHVVFGGPIETGLRAAVMGLLTRGKKVVLVSDGISFLEGDRASSHLAAMAAEGCQFMTLDGVLKQFVSR